MSISLKSKFRQPVVSRTELQTGIVAHRPLDAREKATLKRSAELLTALARSTPRAELKAELAAEAARLQSVLASGQMVGAGRAGLQPSMEATLDGVDKYLSQVECQFPPGTAMGNLALARHEDLRELQWLAKRNETV